MRVLTQNDYKVFSKVFASGANSKITGITVAELKESTELSSTKVRVAIKSLIDYGFVNIGISKGREKTYYITSSGANELKTISKPVIQSKKESVDNE